MRIELDKEACTGHGRCYSLAPDVFEADDDGYCARSPGEIPPELETSARHGAGSCPEQALTIIED